MQTLTDLTKTPVFIKKFKFGKYSEVYSLICFFCAAFILLNVSIAIETLLRLAFFTFDAL